MPRLSFVFALGLSSAIGCVAGPLTLFLSVLRINRSASTDDGDTESSAPLVT